jgi:signal peptidase I
VSGVDERETPLEPPLGEEHAAAGDGGTGWPTTPAEIPLDGPEGPFAETEPETAPTVHHTRHSRNPVDRLTRGLPDPVRVVVDWAVTIIGAIAIVLLVKAYVVNPYRIPSSSMEPTLHLRASRLRLRGALLRPRTRESVHLPPARPPPRRDRPSFDTPDAARVKCGAGGTFVKRLIGLPGDTVEVRLKQGLGYVFINGKQLREPYLKADRRSGEEFGPVKVAPGHYFMMGDNRAQSCDSREWGTVPRGNLIGKVFATYWPPNRLSIH